MPIDTDLITKNAGLIYRGLIKQIKSGEGWGYHNNDQGYPILHTAMENIHEQEKYKATYGMFQTVSSLARV